MRRILVALIAASLIATSTAPAHAQSMPWINPGIISSTTGTDVLGITLQDTVSANTSERNPANNSLANSLMAPSRQSGAAAATMKFTYRYDRARTKANLRNFVARTPNAEAKASLEQIIAAQPTIFDDIRAGIAPYGLDSHDVADAYAMWWINAWLAYEGLDQDTDRGTVAMVKQQVRNAFAATPDMAKSSDAQRQEYAEALLLQGLMLSAAIDQLKSDPAMMRQLSQSVEQGAKASGLDLSLMTLTANGFVPRKGADATGAAGDADGTIRNARADPPEADGGSSDMGLALAAGAGVGVTLLGGLALMRQR